MRTAGDLFTLKTKGPLKIFIDGASSGNPGPAGAGIVILDAQNRLVLQEAVPLGKATNNQAEYLALLLALRHLVALGNPKAVVYTDSELLYNQLTGRYRVRADHLRSLHLLARAYLQTLKVPVEWVARERNQQADRLARKAVQQQRRS